MQMLFQYDLSGNDPETILGTFEPLRTLKADTRAFAAKLVEGTIADLERIDDLIVKQAQNWRIERMAAVDRNILRMAVYEFLNETGTPKLVVIDEAIEIARTFGDAKSPQFVNGILDGILKRYNLQDE